MTNKHFGSSVLAACGFIVFAQATVAQQPLQYREFQLGSNLASIAKQTGTPASGAKIIHVRPADLKDLEYRPRYYSSTATPQTDPVDIMLFRFYDDQLFKIIV